MTTQTETLEGRMGHCLVLVLMAAVDILCFAHWGVGWEAFGIGLAINLGSVVVGGLLGAVWWTVKP